MKPYIMNYSDECRIKPSAFDYCSKTQLNLLPNGEKVISKLMCDHTTITETVESSDPDQLEMDHTVLTRAVEPVDPDEILLDGTTNTAAIEGGDPDEIIL